MHREENGCSPPGLGIGERGDVKSKHNIVVRWCRHFASDYILWISIRKELSKEGMEFKSPSLIGRGQQEILLKTLKVILCEVKGICRLYKPLIARPRVDIYNKQWAQEEP
jgi:hypothetical protein